MWNRNYNGYVIILVLLFFSLQKLRGPEFLCRETSFRHSWVVACLRHRVSHSSHATMQC